MPEISIIAASQVTEADLRTAKLGTRFGRMDLSSRLALVAVENLGVDFDSLPRERIGLCLAARAGSLATDVEYWKGRDAIGGPSPMLFTYTLPSSALGEIAIRFQINGPNLCFVGEDSVALAEAASWLRAGEAEGCICVSCHAVTPEAAPLVDLPAGARATAVFLQRGGAGSYQLEENDRDMSSLVTRILAEKC